jgi:hypothetical protein
MSIPLDDPLLIEHVVCMLNSYSRWTGRELIPIEISPQQRTKELFYQPFVVLHGTQEDPILNYGNQAALELWEMTWEEFTSTPSRLTAEPVNRKERTRLLAQVRRNGYIDTYRGVRISKSGRRFLVEQATVWNILDMNNRYTGQAATFSSWAYL